MSNADKERVPEDQTAKNIKFLRKNVGLTISGLAALVEIDPINLYEYEKENFEFHVMESLNDIIDIANYFAVRLDVLIYTDIEKEKLIKDEWFQQLKKEMTDGIKADRKVFV